MINVGLLIFICCHITLSNYHNNDEIVEKILQINSKCPQITHIVKIENYSSQFKNITGIIFGRSPAKHTIGIPNFRYFANIHGNEVVGRELLLYLIKYMCHEYLNNDPHITKLIKLTRIHIIPTINPDGFDMAKKSKSEGRKTAQNIDMNRDFPIIKPTERNPNANISRNNGKLKAKETRKIVEYITDTPFVLGATLHGGSNVVVYPYDLNPSGNDVYTQCPDDRTFIYISRKYTNFLQKIDKYAKCTDDQVEFDMGITNGALWYSMDGGLMDFSYLGTNAFELTVEMSCDKFPPWKDISGFWSQHRYSLVNFIWQTHLGVKGVVRGFNSGKPLPNIRVKVRDTETNEYIEHDIYTNQFGEYYRLLAPGKYTLYVTESDGTDIVVESQESCGGCEAKIINFKI